MENKMFVVVQSDDNGDNLAPVTKTAEQIIKDIDMFDCFQPAIYKVFDVTKKGNLKPLKVHGCWSEANDPLLIRLLDGRGKVVISGYGTDH